MIYKAYSILIRFRYLWLALSVLTALGGVYWYGYMKGKAAAENSAAVAALEKQDGQIKNRKEVEHEVKNLDRERIIERLRFRGELRNADDY